MKLTKLFPQLNTVITLRNIILMMVKITMKRIKIHMIYRIHMLMTMQMRHIMNLMINLMHILKSIVILMELIPLRILKKQMRSIKIRTKCIIKKKVRIYQFMGLLLKEQNSLIVHILHIYFFNIIMKKCMPCRW